MKLIHKLLFVSIILFMFSPTLLYSAFLRDMPVTVSQPNGEILNCFASGDEYHNWLHDAKGFTIIQSPQTGYYVYAEKVGEILVAGNLIAGLSNPKNSNLVPNINISQAKYRSLRESKFTMPETRDAPTTGTINNLVIFIRFSDETEFNKQISTYEGWFNSNASSQKNYFLEASYNQLTVNTTFYPTSSNGYVVSWQDSHPRSYYQPYNSVSNPNGYQDDTESRNREFTLLENAITSVSSSIPESLVIDADNDGRVDNVVFTVKGGSDGWSDLLWPHRWSLWDRYVYLNGKRVYDFNFQLEEFLDSSNVGVICHEFFHTLGAPDLYHYNEEFLSPVGNWDLMEGTTNPPQHMGAYMKYKYGDWITSIPTISADGQYTLNPLTSSTNNCFRINSPNSGSEYFVVEYRKQEGSYESSLPGSGLLIYRINPAYDGNADGPPDEVYIYRPNGTSTVNGSIYSAHYSSNVGRRAINATSNPNPFLTDGSAGGLVLSDIGSADATITFVKGQGLATITWTPNEIQETLPLNTSVSKDIIIGNTGDIALNYTLSKPTNSANVLTEGFEAGSMPSGWSQENVSGENKAWEFTTGGYSNRPGSAYEGTKNARFYNNSYTASVSKLITPSMNLVGAESATLTFYHTQTEWYGDQDELRVYYRTSAAASWNLLATYTESIADWTNRTIELPNLSADYQIAFEATGQYGYGVCLDAIEINKEVVGDFTWLDVNGSDSYTATINPMSPSHTISVGLSADGLTPGDYEAELTITSNANNNPIVTIPVSMNVTGTPPPAAIYISPDNSSVNVNVNGYLEWHGTINADGYKVYLSDDQSFTGVTPYEQSETNYNYLGLDYDTCYYWKVVPFNEVGDSNQDIQVWSFTTISDPSIAMPVFLDFEASSETPAEIVQTNMLITNEHASTSNVISKQIDSYGNNAYIDFQSMNNITANSVINFDYRIVDNSSPWNALNVISDNDYLLAQVSTNNGGNFTSIDQINSSNHDSNQDMTNYTIDISSYAGQKVIFRFQMIWDEQENYYFDIDNIFFGNAPEVTIPEGDSSTDPIVLTDENIEIDFTDPSPEAFTLQIFMIPSQPANSSGLPATMDSFLARTWRVISSLPNPGNYNVTFDLAGLAIENYNLVRFFKRANSSEEWVDVINLGGNLSWNGSKVTISGLDSFSEFVPGLDETLPVTLAAFNVSQIQNKYAQINWETASESEVLGYHLLRANTQEAENAIKVTSTLIPATNSSSGSHYSFIDDEVEMDLAYYYWLQTTDLDGSSDMFGPITLKISSSENYDIEDLVLGTQLLGNYPNPFNPATTVSFSVAEAQQVTIDIYNIKGQLVKRVFDERIENPNVKNSVVWNGLDNQGKQVASGIYLTIMKAGKQTFSNKVILMK